jgi:hypothetical protein
MSKRYFFSEDALPTERIERIVRKRDGRAVAKRRKYAKKELQKLQIRRRRRANRKNR